MCDESTRVIFTADRSAGLDAGVEDVREVPVLRSEHVRLSIVQSQVRGTVTSCLALCDNGDSIHFKTLLGIEPGQMSDRDS